MAKQVWMCSLSGKIFETEKDASDYEYRIANDLIESVFKTKHEKDDGGKKYCVDTGELLVPHQGFINFMGGSRTIEADRKIRIMLAKLILISQKLEGDS